jgi:hypothetical protein
MAEGAVVNTLVERVDFSFEGKNEPSIPTPTTSIIEEDIVIETIAPVEDVNAPLDIPKVEVEPVVEKKIFVNEDSENVYNLLVEGKVDDVLSILNEQKVLKEVDKLTPNEIIKLNLQYQNKDFTKDEINDLFDEQYEFPEPIEQELSETDEEFEKRTEKYNKEVKRIESKIARDSKPAIAELQNKIKDIVLPTTKVEPIAIVPSQEDLDVIQKANEKFLTDVNAGLQSFNGYTATFKDEEVEIPVAYKLTEDEKQEILPILELANSNAGEFFKKCGWMDANGNLVPTKIAEDLPLILDKNKIFQQISSETGNKRREASIKAIKNIDYSGGNGGSQAVGKTNLQIQEEFADHFFKNL